MDYYEYENIVGHYFKYGILLLKTGYVVRTLVEDNIMEVWFEDLKKHVTIELEIYIINNLVESSRRKIPFNVWVVKVQKGHTRAIR